MRPFRSGLLLLVALASACSQPAAPRKPLAATTASKAPASSKPATATPPPVVALVAPSSASAVLSGQIKIDAAYALSSGSGTLVANNGAQVIRLNGLVANNGGNAIASGGGGSLRTTANGTPLAAGGAIISNNGSTLVANNAGSYRLAADAAPAPGTSLPAAGMPVSVVSLKTHAYLPLGVDDAGAPVYTVYTDALGGYKLFIPASESGNVLVVANVPETQDDRLAVGAVVPAKDGTAAIDEDTAAAERMVRAVLAAQLTAMLTAADANEGYKQAVVVNKLPEALAGELRLLVGAINDAGQLAGVPTTPGAADIPEVRALAQRVADSVLAYIDYDSVRISLLASPNYKGDTEPVFVAVAEVFEALRANTAKLIAARQAAGGALPFNLPVKVYHGIDTRLDNCFAIQQVPIGKDTDLGQFLIQDIFSRYLVDDFYNTAQAFDASVDPPYGYGSQAPGDPNAFTDPVTHQETTQSDRMDAAIASLMFTVATTLQPLDQQPGDPDSPASQAAQQICRDFAAAHPVFGAPQPQPFYGGTPCYPPGPLSTTFPTEPLPPGIELNGDASPAATPAATPAASPAS